MQAFFTANARHPTSVRYLTQQGALLTLCCTPYHDIIRAPITLTLQKRYITPYLDMVITYLTVQGFHDLLTTFTRTRIAMDDIDGARWWIW